MYFLSPDLKEDEEAEAGKRIISIEEVLESLVVQKIPLDFNVYTRAFLYQNDHIPKIQYDYEVHKYDK